LDAAGEEALEDFAAGRHLDLDSDARVAAAETAERVREQVDAGGSRSAEMDRAGLQSCDRAELLLCCFEGGKGLGGSCGEHVPRVGEAAAAPCAFDEALARSGLQEPQMLARARLADADRGGGGGDASLSLDFHEQAHSGRVPELVQGGGGRHLCYR